MNRIVWTGVVVTLLGLCTLAGWARWSNTRSWTLIDGVPISLAKGSHYSSSELRVNFNTRYFIEVYAENRIDSKQLRCMLGAWNPPDICDRSAALRVRWVVSGPGAPVERTSDGTLGAGAWGGSDAMVSRDLGQFYAQKSHNYRLDLYVLSDSQALNSTNPRLYVHVQGDELVSNLVWSGLIRLGCYGLMVVGVLISVWGIYQGRRTRTMQQLQ